MAQEQNLTAFDLSAFGEKILGDMGLSDLPEPERSQLLDTIRTRAEDRLVLTLFSNLSDEQAAELAEKLKDENTSVEGVIQFVASQTPDLPQKLTQALEELYGELVAEAKTLAGKA